MASYKDKTVFQTVGVKTNGSRTFKQGIEFSLSTRRIRALATKLIVSGAYFKTRYENSEPQYVLTTVQLQKGRPILTSGFTIRTTTRFTKYATPISCSTPRFPNWG